MGVWEVAVGGAAGTQLAPLLLLATPEHAPGRVVPWRLPAWHHAAACWWEERATGWCGVGGGGGMDGWRGRNQWQAELG